MKVKCEIIMELDTGNYRVIAHNLSSPGEPMDYARVQNALRKVIENWQPGPAAAPEEPDTGE